MLAEFIGVLLILLVAFLVAGLLGGVHKLLGPRRDFAEKLEPFECGERQIVSPKQRFSVKFYLVAMLFIVFDIETVFMVPWAVAFRQMGEMSGVLLLEMFTFVLILGVGYIYLWKRGALQWD